MPQKCNSFEVVRLDLHRLMGAGNTVYAQLKASEFTPHLTYRSGVVLVTEGVSATVKKTLVNFEL